MEITLKNYRAFSDQRPATWELSGPFTAIVGVNNAGKSSLLRFFHEARTAFILAGQEPGLFLGAPRSAPFMSVADVEEVFFNGNDRNLSARFRLPPGDPPPPGQIEPSSVIFQWRRPDASLTVEFEINGVDVSATTLVGSLPYLQQPSGNHPLAIGRYLKLFADLANSLYLGPFRNAVNIGTQSDYYDLEIGQAFISRWDQLKSGVNQRRQNQRALAVEEELRQIFGLRSLQINAAPGDTTLQVVADGRSYQLQEQGAGFAQFVVVLAYIATREPAYVFIDEPELNLHPALQLDFLTTLAKYTTQGVGFATHSIGLARAAAQRIYSVRRLSNGQRDVRRLEATRDLVEFLGELSLSGYQELGFRQILLVEGTTEVLAVQGLLRLYGIEHEVVLLPLGGASMINAKSQAALDEVRRITTKVSVLIDSEKPSAEAALDEEREAFVSTCKDLGFNVHVLERRAFENYFTDAAIKSALGEKHQELGLYDRLKDAAQPWAKGDNWRIAAAMTKDDLNDNDLGRFLEGLAAEPTTEPDSAAE